MLPLLSCRFSSSFQSSLVICNEEAKAKAAESRKNAGCWLHCLGEDGVLCSGFIEVPASFSHLPFPGQSWEVFTGHRAWQVDSFLWLEQRACQCVFLFWRTRPLCQNTVLPEGARNYPLTKVLLASQLHDSHSFWKSVLRLSLEQAYLYHSAQELEYIACDYMSFTCLDVTFIKVMTGKGVHALWNNWRKFNKVIL